MQFKSRFSLVEREEILVRSENCLWSDKGKPGRDYLLTTRQLSESVIKKFRLGYVPLTAKHQLNGRIVFPFFDPSGNLIAISTRYIHEDEPFLPVYWHESYEKSFYLYGMHVAKDAIVREGYNCIVEGQIDVLQCHNHGMDNVVGICSTNFSDMQLSVIYRYCDEIIIAFDRDVNQSGQKATERALDKANSFYQNGNLNRQCDDPKFKPCYIKSSNLWAKRKIASIDFGVNADPDEFIKEYGIEPLKNLITKKVEELRNGYIYF